MWSTSDWMLSVAAVCLAAGVGWFTRALFFRPIAQSRLLISYARALKRELEFVRSPISANVMLAAQMGLLLFGSLVVVLGSLYGVVPVCFAIFSRPLLRVQAKKRATAIEKQIEGWMGALAGALESSPSLGEAIEVSMTMCDAPLQEELGVVVNELRLGQPLDRALTAFASRVGSRTVSLALCTLVVGRQTGGRLNVVLKAAASSLREIERLEGVLRTKTAEGRAQAWVISVVPVPLYFAVKWGDPGYFTPLESTASGHILVGIAVVLWLLAGFSARKILAVQI